MKGLKEIVNNLANRINQPHYLENELKKVFNAGVEWERSRDKWISVEERWPEYLQSVAFVIDHPGSPRHGKVYGGTFTGGNPNYDKPINEFSTPSFGTSASHWQPLPEPPKKEGEK